ncbi:TetR/AcrR family transcriptional regulator [Frankia sp. R82]|uniref:TetR/AcrR family transcriptional regulator n=1 Tax=Frankia sp. R82 TaxID=2950553 RepID=UPI002044B615|nr:TetR/AcrR family transcriptional regulator [Frankia sp. R82]MCM3886044.1 TetR/AcrR family transcriptional regulator [Frankia sp. R82]
MARSGAVLRGQLLDVALRLFGQRGFRGTSLQDIAKEVGCSKASLLYHFASKEAIFNELLTPSMTAFDALNETLQNAPTPVVARQAVEGFVDVVIRYRQQIAMVLQQASEAAEASIEGNCTTSEQRAELLVTALSGRSTDPYVRLRSRMAIGAITVAAASPETDMSTEAARQELVDGALRLLCLA